MQLVLPFPAREAWPPVLVPVRPRRGHQSPPVAAPTQSVMACALRLPPTQLGQQAVQNSRPQPAQPERRGYRAPTNPSSAVTTTSATPSRQHPTPHSSPVPERPTDHQPQNSATRVPTNHQGLRANQMQASSNQASRRQKPTTTRGYRCPIQTVRPASRRPRCPRRWQGSPARPASLCPRRVATTRSSVTVLEHPTPVTQGPPLKPASQEHLHLELTAHGWPSLRCAQARCLTPRRPHSSTASTHRQPRSGEVRRPSRRAPRCSRASGFLAGPGALAQSQDPRPVSSLSVRTGRRNQTRSSFDCDRGTSRSS